MFFDLKEIIEGGELKEKGVIDGSSIKNAANKWRLKVVESFSEMGGAILKHPKNGTLYFLTVPKELPEKLLSIADL